MSKTLEQLTALISDPDFLSLSDQSPAPSLFYVLGIERHELAHTRLLAWLLDPAESSVADALASLLLRHIADVDPLSGITPQDADQCRIASISREYEHIDIVATVDTPTRRLLLAIENKIDAQESPGQLARYQTVLSALSLGKSAVLLFLTPEGRPPSTASKTSATPCIPLSYAFFVSALRSLPARSSAREMSILEHARQHLEETIVGESETKQKIRELWLRYPRAVRALVAQRPRLTDILLPFQNAIHNRLTARINVELHPNRDKARELKLRFLDLVQKGLPLTFMLHADIEKPIRLRVFVSDIDFRSHEKTLRSWAAQVNSTTGAPLIMDDFPLVQGWEHWRSVLAEDSVAGGLVLTDQSFTRATAEEAADMIVAVLRKLGLQP